MNRMRCWILVGFTVVVGLGTSGCGSQYLKKEDFKSESGFYVGKDAEIEDTQKNRRVLDVIRQYRSALIQKDIGALKRLIADDYYDNAGTTDTTEDDYGRERLPKIFETVVNHAEKIEYKVTIKNIKYERNRALVEYEYRYAYKYQVGKKPTWDAGVEMNQVELVSKNGTWKIASGL